MGLLLCAGVSLAACGGNGAATNTPTNRATPGPAATANYTAPTVPSQGTFRDSATVPVPSPSPNATSLALGLPSDANGDTGTLSLPLSGATIPSGTVAHFTLSASADAGLPPLSARRLMAVRSTRDTVGHTAIAFADIDFTNDVVLTQTPAFTFTAAGAYPTSGISYYLALYDPLRPSLGWQYGFEGPAAVTTSGGTTQLAFAGAAHAFTFSAYQVYSFAVVAVSAQAPAPTPAPSGAPAVAPSATPAPVVATPSALTFFTKQPSATQTFSVSESGYGGAFTVTPSAGCANVATVSGSGSTFTVTPSGAGTCQVLIAGDRGANAGVSISVSPTVAYVALGTKGVEALTASGTVIASYPYNADELAMDDAGNIYALTNPSYTNQTMTAPGSVAKYAPGSTTRSATYTPSTGNIRFVLSSGAGEIVTFGYDRTTSSTVYDVWDAGKSGSPSRTFTYPNSSFNAAFVTHDGTAYLPYNKTCNTQDTCVFYDVIPAGASAPGRTIAETIVPTSQQVNFVPNYTTVAPDGTLYVAENSLVPPDPLAGLYVYPPSGGETYVANGAAAPQGIDTDSSGNVYVMNDNISFATATPTSDTLHTISVLAPRGTSVTRQYASGFAFGFPITVADDGTIFFSTTGYQSNTIDPNGAVYSIAPGTTTPVRIATTATDAITVYDGVREKTFVTRSTLSAGARGAAHGSGRALRGVKIR